MSVCPITLQPYSVTKELPLYSKEGLRRLHRGLSMLEALPFSAADQLQEAAARADKMSVQGVQPKLSAVLRISEKHFELADTGGRFILKPCPSGYTEVPENEALTMTLASTCGIEVPDHGLVAAADGSWTYWVRRFDREKRKDRVPLEDFAQLQGRTRDTKYDSSMEQVIATIDQHCSFPLLEKRKLALRVLFCFVTGNEDMHLKNFSLISRSGRHELSPAYDLLNTSIVLQNPSEEMALPIRGRKRNLSRKDLVSYFCSERCGLSDKIVGELLTALEKAASEWPAIIDRSFLSDKRKAEYTDLLRERRSRLFGV